MKKSLEVSIEVEYIQKWMGIFTMDIQKTIYKNPKLETTEIPIIDKMNKYIVLYIAIYNGIIYIIWVHFTKVILSEISQTPALPKKTLLVINICY